MYTNPAARSSTWLLTTSLMYMIAFGLSTKISGVKWHKQKHTQHAQPVEIMAMFV
ncbi:MAG TPA: hypothetical protein VFR47_21395 [Anaerolineales bacterium]|nr:hypothetical protein [Anaerolineales bacterium]